MLSSTVRAILALGLVGTATGQARAQDAMAKEKAMAMEKDKMMMAKAGTFTGAAGHKAQGSFSIEGNSLAIADGFEVEKAPDIYVLLSKGATITEATSVNLGKLTSLKGRQSYTIPATANLANYDTVVLWCKKYNMNMGTGPIGGKMDHGAIMDDKAMMDKEKMAKEKMMEQEKMKKN